ncbi:MAG: HAD family hydrolase [Myxococcales bacterium]|nr:HAD family hydrolase [Myxococcales bacterium]
MTEADLRARAEEAVRQGHVGEARSCFEQLLSAKPSAATAGAILRHRAALSSLTGRPAGADADAATGSEGADSQTGVRPVRVAFLRSFTLEPVLPLLEAYALCLGLPIETWVGDFNAYPQELLDPHSALYAFEPDVVFLCVLAEDLVPALVTDFAGQSHAAVESTVDDALASLQAWLRAFRAASSAPLVLQNLELPTAPNHGVWDAQAELSQREVLGELNRRLRAVCRSVPSTYVLDYDALVARHGAQAWRDQHRWLTARMPLSRQALLPLAKEYARLLLPLAGRMAKVLVLDLDDTLWGGVLGEVGLAGLQLGSEHPGAAYQALQRVALDLHQRGVLLAISSKNDAADALAALREHPGMLLREAQLAATRINWNDKAQSCRELAAELNVGTDSLVFLDDNPAERARVRLELPEVYVPELPSDPVAYAACLRDVPLFERVALTDEDRSRGRFYAAAREREAHAGAASNVEDYYRSLAMQARFAEVTPLTLARVAQLTQKTNQFNVTTKRYSEADVLRLAREGHVYTMSASDRFGDHGIVGVAITLPSAEGWEIDTFLMSCRVIGRTLETAMLAFVSQQALAADQTRLTGWVVPTAKNEPARGFYSAHGFREQARDGDAVCYHLDLTDGALLPPAWVDCHVEKLTS